MNLYLLKQTANTGYDTYDSYVVCAETVHDARMVTPALASFGERFPTWADKPEEVDVTYLGEADPSIEAGTVICASFNAG